MSGEDILAKVTAKRFNDIFANSIVMTELDINLYFKLIEKFVVIGEGLIKACLMVRRWNVGVNETDIILY